MLSPESARALPNKQPLLLTDTIGFIRKLPHDLIESFNTTLEEAALSDFLIHVLDASHPRVLEFYETTKSVLEELVADTSQALIVFNKMDRVNDETTRIWLRGRFPEAIFISVHSGQGLDELVARQTRTVEMLLPLERPELLARLHREGTVHSIAYEETVARVLATVPPRLHDALAGFMVPSSAPRP